MKKVYLYVLLTALIFSSCSCEFNLSNWKQLFGIKEITEDLDHKLGDIFWESYRAEMTEVKDSAVAVPIQQMVSELCSAL